MRGHWRILPNHSAGVKRNRHLLTVSSLALRRSNCSTSCFMARALTLAHQTGWVSFAMSFRSLSLNYPS